MEWLIQAAAVLVAYLVGSLSFAVIVSRLMGLNDPRSYGSKNPGATNVLRSGSKPAALLTLALDALKGYVPVLLPRYLPHDWKGGFLLLVMVFVTHYTPDIIGGFYKGADPMNFAATAPGMWVGRGKPLPF